jgi:hypothetical protein
MNAGMKMLNLLHTVFRKIQECLAWTRALAVELPSPSDQ